MIFISADVFHTMLVKQSETRASALSDGSALSMILPATFASGLPTQRHVMKWDRVSGVKQQVSDLQLFHVQMLITAAGGGLDNFYKTQGERLEG